jgi:pyruvate,water dikinase
MNILFSPWWFLQYLLAQFLASQQRSQIINHFYSVFQPTVIACSQELEKINFVDYPLARLNDLLSKTINYYVRECSKYTIEAAIISHISWESLKNLMLKTGLKAEAQSLFFAPSLPNQTIRLHQAAYELRWREITKAEFLKKFGHRGMNELEFMAPRFGEDDQELQCFISLSKQSLAPFDLLKKVQLKKKNKLKGLERKLEYQPLLFYKITKEIALLEDCIQFRENVKDCLLRLLWQIRRLGLAIQTKLGIKDLFYLVPEEIINLANKEEAIAIIKERKQKRAELLKINLPTVIFQKDIEQLGTIDLKKEQHKLKGLTVCPGIIQGRVRVIRNKKILPKITKQTILVLPDADPVWTMLFAQARGLIIEKGGILSHSAIIAREYDIPTIINVSDATKILKDGQWVRMDAGKGEVVVE